MRHGANRRHRDGRFLSWFGAMTNIGDHKRSVIPLSTSDERRLATEVLAGFLYDYDAIHDRAQRFGPMEAIIGFSADAVPSERPWWQSRMHPEELPGALARAALDGGAPAYYVEYRFRHRDGRYVDLAEMACVIRDASDRVVPIVGGMRADISARRHLEQEHEALLAREQAARALAEEALRGRDQLLGIVSHDLGGFLSAIAMCASAMLDASEPYTDHVRGILRAIQQSAQSANRLLRDLLDMAAIQSGRLGLELQAVAPSMVAEATAELFRATAREGSVALELRVEPELPAVLADADRLLQALGNLVSNALKFTRYGGFVRIAAARDPAGVCFSVEDSGIGIDAGDLPHVFDRFWQKPRAGQVGTGLGLAIVRGIIEAHGGRVAVTSTVESGSCFSFTVPLMPLVAGEAGS